MGIAKFQRKRGQLQPVIRNHDEELSLHETGDMHAIQPNVYRNRYGSRRFATLLRRVLLRRKEIQAKKRCNCGEKMSDHIAGICLTKKPNGKLCHCNG
jgi:hypothetical protein